MTPQERRLRELRLQARAEAEEVEHAAAELDSARSTFAEVCFGLGEAGREVVVETATSDFTGRIAHVGTGLVGLACRDTTEVVVSLSHVIGLRDCGAGVAGPVTTGHPLTIESRCRELAGTGVFVEIQRSAGSGLRGAIESAGAHHIELQGSAGRWHVPIRAVAAISLTVQ